MTEIYTRFPYARKIVKESVVRTRVEEEKETQDSYGKKLQKYCEVTSEIR